MGVELAGCKEKSERKITSSRAQAIKEETMKAFGNVLGTALEGRKALIILSDAGVWNKAVQSSLKKGIGGKFSIVAFAAPPRQDIQSGRSRGTYSSDDFDTLLDAHDGYDVVVSLIGFPEDVEEMAYWKRDAATRPPFVIATLQYGSPASPGLKTAMDLGWCEGVVVVTQGYRADDNQSFRPTSDLDIGALRALLEKSMVYVDASDPEAAAKADPPD